MKQNFEYISNSIQGLHREKNQDRTLIIEHELYNLYVIFDGLSSHPDSYKFIEYYINFIYENHLKYIDAKANNLNKLLYGAHLETIKQNFDGLSTISGLFVSEELDYARYFNIGDSRIYKLKQEKINQITLDDKISKIDHLITRCLGLTSLQLYDCRIFNVDKNNNFLLCTDGFYPLMEQNIKKYLKIFQIKNLKDIKQNLFDIQKDLNNDDSTYIFINRGLKI